MKSALLIIDVQEGLFSPSPQPYQGLNTVNNINLLIAKARSQQVPIIFIQHEDSCELEYASNSWQLFHRLHSTENDFYIRKTTPNSFLRTALHELLNSLNIEQCIICGYASEFCIDTTVRQSASLGFNVMLVKDAHTTHDKPHAKAKDIIDHHTISLSSMTSFNLNIIARATNEIDFN